MIQESNSWAYIQKKTKTKQKHNLKIYIHPNVHCSTIYNSQDVELAYMSINRGMDKEDVVHIYSEILAIKNNKIMPLAATWMDLEIILLNEVSQKEI